MHGVAAHVHHGVLTAARGLLVVAYAGASAAIGAVGIDIGGASRWSHQMLCLTILHIEVLHSGSVAFIEHLHILSRGFAKAHKGAE